MPQAVPSPQQQAEPSQSPGLPSPPRSSPQRQAVEQQSAGGPGGGGASGVRTPTGIYGPPWPQGSSPLRCRRLVVTSPPAASAPSASLSPLSPSPPQPTTPPAPAAPPPPPRIPGFSLDPAAGWRLRLPNDPLLRAAVASVHTWRMPPELRALLPITGDAASPHWSALGAVLAGCTDAVCYPEVLQRLKHEITRQCQARGVAGLEGLRPPPPAAGDVEAMAAMLYEADPAAFEVEIGTPPGESPRHNFHLEYVWESHQECCPPCRARGSFAQAVLGKANATNPCYIRVVLSILDGRWRLPLVAEPEPYEREAGNYTCFKVACKDAPETTLPLVEKFRDRVLRPVQPTEAPPVLVCPLTVALKEPEIVHRLDALQLLGRPCPGFTLQMGSKAALVHTIKQLDHLNRHIRMVCDEVPALARQHGLKPIKLRVCTDLGRLNAVVQPVTFAYPTVWNLVALMARERATQNGKTDFSDYFWELPVARSDEKYMGVRLDGQLYVAEHVQFGGTISPFIANLVSGALSRVLTHRGIPNICYTDDFATTGAAAWERVPAPLRCGDRMERMIEGMEAWGLKVNPAKTEGPASDLTFLGIVIDEPNRRLCIPREKLVYYRAVVTHALQQESTGQGVSSRLLESVVGCLGRVSLVLPAGRVRLARIRGCDRAPTRIRHFDRRVQLSAGAQEDLRWWLARLTAAIDHAEGCWAPFWTTSLPVTVRIFHDASGDEARGFGLAMGDQVYQGFWKQTGAARSSAYRELIPVLLALHLFQPARGAPTDPVMVVTSDNAPVAVQINKGSCKSADSDCYPLLFQVFELAEKKGVFLLADWVPREHNVLMDEFSKGVRVA